MERNNYEPITDNPTHPCALCADPAGYIGDPHVGDVCTACYVDLIYVRRNMEDLGFPICADPRKQPA